MGLKQYLERFAGSLGLEDWKLLEGILQPLHIGRGKELLSKGSTCQHIWYVESGALRQLEYRDGSERTTRFFYEPSMLTAYHSLITRTPSDLALRAASDCDLIALPYTELLRLYQQSHALERIGRLYAEEQFATEIQQHRSQFQLDARQRYEQLEMHQPQVFQRFLLQDIATAIGTAPETLAQWRQKPRA